MNKHIANIDYRISLVLISIGILVGVPMITEARTWYVNQAGSGDAPTITAAVDSSVSGDTVLVGPGRYEIGSPIWPKSGTVITSEYGALDTRLVPKPLYAPAYCFACRFFMDRTEISGFWIEGFLFGSPDSGAITVVDCHPLYIQHNVLVNNTNAAIAVATSPTSEVFIENNTMVSEEGNYAVLGNGFGIVRNNIIWGRGDNLERTWLVTCNCMMDVSDAGFMAVLNFEADPQFCGSPANGNVLLQEDSPCAPGNTPPPLSDCGLVGALPVGCNTTPVKTVTWGYFKSLYK